MLSRGGMLEYSVTADKSDQQTAKRSFWSDLGQRLLRIGTAAVDFTFFHVVAAGLAWIAACTGIFGDPSWIDVFKIVGPTVAIPGGGLILLSTYFSDKERDEATRRSAKDRVAREVAEQRTKEAEQRTKEDRAALKAAETRIKELEFRLEQQRNGHAHRSTDLGIE